MLKARLVFFSFFPYEMSLRFFKECGLEVETDSGSISQHCRVDIQRGHLKKIVL